MKTVTYKDKSLTLTQDAYRASDTHYEAHAKDADDNDYLVHWSITNESAADETDESNMCDWDNYTVRDI